VRQKQRPLPPQPATAHASGGQPILAGRPAMNAPAATAPAPTVCPVCQKGFSSKSGLKLHLLIHEDKRPWRCGQCGNAFRQRVALQSHERLHTGEAPYVCCVPGCSQACKSPQALRSHVLLVHKLGISRPRRPSRRPAGPFVCPDCHKSFCSAASHGRHLRHPWVQCGRKITKDVVVSGADHLLAEPHCRVCNKSYSGQRTLHLHFRDVHCVYLTLRADATQQQQRTDTGGSASPPAPADQAWLAD